MPTQPTQSKHNILSDDDDFVQNRQTLPFKTLKKKIEFSELLRQTLKALGYGNTLNHV